MSVGAIVGADVTDDARLAEARERFLTGLPVGAGQVRDTVLASWRRSRERNVAADHIDLSYVHDPDLDTPLTRSALPVLRSLTVHQKGQPISIMLADARSELMSRLPTDDD